MKTPPEKSMCAVKSIPPMLTADEAELLRCYRDMNLMARPQMVALMKKMADDCPAANAALGVPAHLWLVSGKRKVDHQRQHLGDSPMRMEGAV